MKCMISDDSSRVKLKEVVGEDGSDYINASHLDVKSCLLVNTGMSCYKLIPPLRVTTSPRHTLVLKVSTKHCSVIILYSTLIGPMSNTVSDFWRMIWEKKLPTVVMLTRVFEGRVCSIDVIMSIKLLNCFEFCDPLEKV